MSSPEPDPPLAEDDTARSGSDALQILEGCGAAVTDPKFRHLRAAALQILLDQAHRGLRLCDFRNELVVRPEGIFVDAGGILLEAVRSRIYLKTSGRIYANQAEAIGRVLAEKKISVATALDIGANFGEISLWLAREYPAARVIAVEPSSDNLEILRINVKAQRFSTGRVEIVPEGVAARRQTVPFVTGIGTMNRVLPAARGGETEDVMCDRLDTLFDRLGVRVADFVKIDIEGGEPTLSEAIVRLGNRVRSYYIEFSRFAPLENYLSLAQALIESGFDCYDEPAATVLGGLESIDKHVRAFLARPEVPATNLWFISGNRA